MSHQHVGPEDYACTGCISDRNAGEKRKAIAGWALLIALVIGGMALLSHYLSGRS